MELIELKEKINKSGIFQRGIEVEDIKTTMNNGYLLVFNKGRNTGKIFKQHEIFNRLEKKGIIIKK